VKERNKVEGVTCIEGSITGSIEFMKKKYPVRQIISIVHSFRLYGTFSNMTLSLYSIGPLESGNLTGNLVLKMATSTL
jgi:hypothetical protein